MYWKNNLVCRHGFTLVELLVVLCIISILTAMLLPALMRAREIAQLCACMSNQKQMGVALTTYAGDWTDFPVYQYDGMPARTWGNRNRWGGESFWQRNLPALEASKYLNQKIGYCTKFRNLPNNTPNWWRPSDDYKFVTGDWHDACKGNYLYIGIGANGRWWQESYCPRLVHWSQGEFSKNFQHTAGVHADQRSYYCQTASPFNFLCEDRNKPTPWSGRPSPLMGCPYLQDWGASGSPVYAPHFPTRRLPNAFFIEGGKLNFLFTDCRVKTYPMSF